MIMQCLHDVYLADTARVVGDVELAPGVSIWFGVAIRGDVAKVSIGRGSNVQDNAVIHCDSHIANVIGEDVSIGHSAIVHGISIGDGTLIGMGAVVLGGTRIGKRCLIAAGAVVPPNLQVPDDSVVMGVPGKIVRPTTAKERDYLAWLAPHYVTLAKLHHEQPGDPRVRPWGT